MDTYPNGVTVRWVPIDRGTYHAIYANLHDELMVFSTHTCMEGCELHAQPYILTAWGLKTADAPLIRSVKDDGVFSYAIAHVEVVPEPW